MSDVNLDWYGAENMLRLAALLKLKAAAIEAHFKGYPVEMWVNGEWSRIDAPLAMLGNMTTYLRPYVAPKPPPPQGQTVYD